MICSLVLVRASALDQLRDVLQIYLYWVIARVFTNYGGFGAHARYIKIYMSGLLKLVGS